MVRKNKNKGFTLVELVLYMGILAIFMVAVINLIAQVTNSNSKLTSRRKVQNQASEAYDSISDMLMSAVDVKISGTAYIYTEGSGSTPVKKTGIFIVPEADYDYVKNTDGTLMDDGASAYITEKMAAVSATGTVGSAAALSASCYDIADIVSFGDTATPSTDDNTYIVADGDLYLYIKYASGIDADGDTIYTCCTLTYSEADGKIYAYKCDGGSTYDGVFVDASNASDGVFCKYVDDFKLQVNPDEDSISVVLDLEDTRSAYSYSLSGVVGLRNSYVLKAHEWN